jgi:hypothetical protein
VSLIIIKVIYTAKQLLLSLFCPFSFILEPKLPTKVLGWNFRFLG